MDSDKHLTATEKQHIVAVFNSDLNDGKGIIDGAVNGNRYLIKDVSTDDGIYSVQITKNTKGLGFIGDKSRVETMTYKVKLF